MLELIYLEKSTYLQISGLKGELEVLKSGFGNISKIFGPIYLKMNFYWMY